MDLKIIVLLLFIALVISLSSGFVFLLKDVSSPKKRTLYALGTRVTLASVLMATIFYGLYSGQLGSTAPWDKKLSKEQYQQLLLQEHQQKSQASQ